MIIHVFNSSVVSGPETLAIPALKNLERDLNEPVEIIFLHETRVDQGAKEVVAYFERFNYRVHSITVRSRIDLQAIKDLKALILKLKPRVLHAHDTKASLYLWRACVDRKNFDFSLKLVSTHHGAAARKGIIRFYEEIYVRLCLNFFDHVLCMGKMDYTSLSERGIKPEKLQIHINGVDRPKVSEEVRAYEQGKIRAAWTETEPRLAHLENFIWLGVVARLGREKRHDRMLEVIAHLKKRGVNAALICFGRGAEEETLKSLTRSLGIEDRVFWMGYRKTIGNELAGFDLTLCLSDGEGIPINLLESGWAGTPVFSTNVGGIPDFIHDGKTGFLVEKSDSNEHIAVVLADVLQSDSKLRSRGLAFQSDVEKNFSERAWLDVLKKVYSK